MKLLVQKIEQIKLDSGHIFYGKSIVLTGTLNKPRDEIVEMLESKGAKISSSVSKKTDFVIYGEKAGSKLEKAQNLGVKTLSEEEFMVRMQES